MIRFAKMEENLLKNDPIVELVDYIARNLVDSPDDVHINAKEDEENGIVVELTVAKDDMGKVIGKQGRIAKSIRTVVRAASVKSDKKYTVEIVEAE